MNKFEFKTFAIDDEEHIEIYNSANFELFLLATTALTFLMKNSDDEAKMKEGEMPEFISYTRWAVDKIRELANSQDIDKTTPEIKQITFKVFECIDHAKRKMNEDPSRLKIGDFEKEFWWFYSEAITNLLDSVKILKSEHKKIKGTDDQYDHNTRIQFKHGQNSWTYNVRIKGDRNLDIKGFMNGVSIDFKDCSDNDDINQEIVTVEYSLRHIARAIAMEKGFNFLCDIANKEPATVSKARTIAIVLGGNYRNYLLIAKHFNESLKNLLAETNMTETMAASHILNKQLRATDNQVSQIISILKPQTSWGKSSAS